jgi:hypothetical protein
LQLQLKIKNKKKMYNNIKNIISIIIVICLLIFPNYVSIAQKKKLTQEELKKQRELLKHLKTQADREEIDITVKSIEISKFPEIKLIVEAYNKLGESLDTLLPEQITIYENGVGFSADKVVKIPVANDLP